MLTDLPIGARAMASLLDTLGGPSAERVAGQFVGVGVAAAVPTAAAGLNDWSDTYGRETRNGCVTCPWHGSTFRLADGGIVRGPASSPQPSYET